MLLKKIISLVTAFLFFFQLTGFSQDATIVQWNATAKKTGEGQYELQLKGAIKDGWHLYAKPIKAADVEGLKIIFSDATVQNDGPKLITGNFKTIGDKIVELSAEVVETSVIITQKIKLSGDVPAKLKATLVYFTATESEFIPQERKVEFELEGGVNNASANRILIPTIDLKNPVNDCGGTGISADDSGSGGLLTIFLLGFLGGLVALITPCVFPMIPLTVSFFTKKAISKNYHIRIVTCL